MARARLGPTRFGSSSKYVRIMYAALAPVRCPAWPSLPPSLFSPCLPYRDSSYVCTSMPPALPVCMYIHVYVVVHLCMYLYVCMYVHTYIVTSSPRSAAGIPPATKPKCRVFHSILAHNTRTYSTRTCTYMATGWF